MYMSILGTVVEIKMITNQQRCSNDRMFLLSAWCFFCNYKNIIIVIII